VREKLTELSIEISERWSLIKRDFMGAPILRALKAVNAKTATAEALNCTIPYRN